MEDAPSLGADFRRLWVGSAISQLGSAAGGVALPLIALGPLRGSNSSVSLLSLLSLLSAVSVIVAAFPAGAFVETRMKRPVMIGADMARSLALAGIPALFIASRLSIAYLCFVAVINGAANVTFSSASQAHLRDLVSDELFIDANGKLLSTLWLGLIIGPSIAGAILAVASPVWLCAIDAMSFLAGALFITTLRQPESAPAICAAASFRRWDLVTGGVRFVWADSRLRSLLLSWTAFAGLASALSPVSQVFYLTTLNFTPSQYGLVMGLPSLGGLIGSCFTRHGAQRLGLERVMQAASWARSVLYLLFPFLLPGDAGVLLAIALYGSTLFTTSLANSAMGSVRVKATPKEYNARVTALWSFAGMIGGPLLMALTTPAMQAFGARPVLAALCGAIALTPLLLPRRHVP